MYSDIVEATVRSNYERFVFDPRMQSRDKRKCLYVMMVDDVKAEKQVRFCERSGRVLGLCYHAHENDVPTEVKSVEDCEAIAQAIEDQTVHLASEVTCVALGGIREVDYNPRFVATSAGCLENDPTERTELLVRASIATYVNDPRGEAVLGRLSTLQPDGASAFVKLGHKLFFSARMDSTHPLHKHLSGLPLFNMFSGRGIYKRIAMGCECKHVFKRQKERIKGEVGFMMFKFCFTGDFLRELLLSTGHWSKDDVKEMFNHGFADASNVPAMVKLYRALADMAKLDPKVFGSRKESVLSVRADLKLLGLICELNWTILCDKKPSLGEHLKNISTLMHITFACYRRNGTKFIPSQNYANLQRYFRSVYWSIANAIEDGIPTYLLFFDSGDRLEEAYGLLRCLNGGASGNGSGMSVLSCCDRISGVMAVQGVLARHPELREASRHLKASVDHQNPRSFLSDENGGTDRSRVEVEGISLKHKYISGRTAATAALREAGFCDSELDWKAIAEDDVDLLRPNGSFVGVTDEEADDEEEMQSKSSCEINVVSQGQLLEEELGAAPDSGDDDRASGGVDSGLIKRSFKVGGKDVSAAKCLRMVLNKQTINETSRMARYSNKPKSGTEVALDKAEDVDAEYIRSGEDIFAALVSPMSGCLALALVTPDQFVLEDGEKSSKVSVRRFINKAKVSGKIITDVKVSEKEISWLSSSRSTHILELFAEDATLLNPEIRLKIDDSSGEEKAELYVDIDTANMLLDKMVLQYREKADKGNKIVLPAPKGATLPYRYKGEDVLFSDVPSSQIMSSSSARAEQRAKNAILKCSVPGCGQKHAIKNMRHHVSWHQIHDKHLSSKVKAGVGPMELCGMCGCHPALTYTKNGAVNGCPTWLVKSKNTFIWQYTCKNHPFDKISYKSAKKSNKLSPSTNVPIKCPECSTGKSMGGRNTTDQHYYKYAFQMHWDECHSNLSMPADLAESIVISQEEKTWLESFATPKKVRSKPRKKPVPVSRMSGTSSIVDSMSSVGDDVGIKDGTNCRPSPSPYFLLQPIADEDAESAIAAFASAHAFREARPRPSDAALVARDADLGYSYQGLAVGTRALASLHGTEFINDEVAECLRLNLNTRAAELANSGDLDYKCCCISSFFAAQLVGLSVPPSQTTRRARTLGFADNEVPFSKKLRETHEKKTE
mmetsp:Transcript_6667/g.14579  ORF Transcript_6667/g.14579 Transcript_6667/m.14579 type:complete len:1179 (+) Transcript_6667:780-4316(+)